jgi:predicted acetyltransferase
VGDDGRFGFKKLLLYWREANRHPFLLKIDGKVAGLVFVKKGSEVSGDETVWDMAEFFVLRAFRRRGIGTQIAHKVWRKFPGQLEIRVVSTNQPASRFWEQAAKTFMGAAIESHSIEKNGQLRHAFSFRSPAHIETD